MISQLQGLKSFVATHLADVADWSQHVRVDEGKTTGDQAYITIATPFNRYQMSICSSYIEPPAGAPVACKSLGTVTFDDFADNKHIVGPKADMTWTDISKHIHVRELTDGLAAARRDLAEGNGSAAKLMDLAERAKKWGIAAKVPDAPKAGEITWLPPGQPFPPTCIEETPVHTDAPLAPASRDAPWLGAPILFITNPGEQVGGMQEIVGWCVKVYSHDRISVFITPDHSEPSYRDNLPRRGSPAGDGNVHRYNCWDFNPEFMHRFTSAQHKDDADAIRVLGRLLDNVSNRIDEIFLSVTRVCDRLEALEARRGPGRPPKPKPESEAA